MRRLAQGLAAVIRVDALWLATQPVDMRAGTDTLLGRNIAVFGEERWPHLLGQEIRMYEWSPAA